MAQQSHEWLGPPGSEWRLLDVATLWRWRYEMDVIEYALIWVSDMECIMRGVLVHTDG